MQRFFNHKLFEIFFEKALIALIILLAGHVANQSIERFKLVEAQRIAGTAAFVDACQEIWAKLYEYEAAIGKSEELRFRSTITTLMAKNGAKAEKELEEHKKLVVIKGDEVSRLINSKRFIIGQQFAEHFWKYMGYVIARADAKKDSLLKFNEDAKIARDSIDAFDGQIASMRFTADMAREYAISKLPK